MQGGPHAGFVGGFVLTGAACLAAAAFVIAGCARRKTPVEVTPREVVAVHTSPPAEAPASPVELGPAETRVVSADGRVSILGRGAEAVHDDPGPPAMIGSAEFKIYNEREKPLQLSVRSIDWLVGENCEVPQRITAHPALGEIRPKDSVNPPGKRINTWTVPPRDEIEIETGYAVQEAFMLPCHRFATRVHFDVDGEPLSVVAEHRVTRRIRRR